MKRFILAAAASAAAIVAAAPASAATYFTNLGGGATVTVPPTQTFSTDFAVQAGAVEGYVNFTLGSTLTMTGATFSSTAPGAVTLSTIAVYLLADGQAFPNGASTGAPGTTPLGANTGTGTSATGTSINLSSPQVLQAGRYSIYLTGNASVANNVSGNVRFMEAAVPEPATWGLMLAGFGMIGFGLRARKAARVTFA